MQGRPLVLCIRHVRFGEAFRGEENLADGSAALARSIMKRRASTAIGGVRSTKPLFCQQHLTNVHVASGCGGLQHRVAIAVHAVGTRPVVGVEQREAAVLEASARGAVQQRPPPGVHGGRIWELVRGQEQLADPRVAVRHGHPQDRVPVLLLRVLHGEPLRVQERPADAHVPPARGVVERRPAGLVRRVRLVEVLGGQQELAHLLVAVRSCCVESRAPIKVRGVSCHRFRGRIRGHFWPLHVHREQELADGGVAGGCGPVECRVAVLVRGARLPEAPGVEEVPAALGVALPRGHVQRRVALCVEIVCPLEVAP
mmetsp:Transcript_80379/g.236498  ORF Transcript_80379/g.236498 Transcript_80379/m.236498 type:complete len:313 (+) Transcript_80379:1394-2332(+)